MQVVPVRYIAPTGDPRTVSAVSERLSKKSFLREMLQEHMLWFPGLTHGLCRMHSAQRYCAVVAGGQVAARIVVGLFSFIFVLHRFIRMLTKAPGDMGMCFRQSQRYEKCSVRVSCSTQACKCFCWLSSRRIQQLPYSWELYPLCFLLLLEEGVHLTTTAVALSNGICMLKLFSALCLLLKLLR